MRFQTLAVFLFLSSTALADEPMPTSLSREEFAAGWVSLFDGETTFGLNTGENISLEKGEKTNVFVKDGVLILGKGGSSTTTAYFSFGNDWEAQIETFGGNLQTGKWLFQLDAKATNGKKWGSITILCVNGKIQKPTNRDIEWKEKAYIEANDNSRIPFQFVGNENHPMSIRTIKIRPTKMVNLFNGKDLSGWKRFAGNPKQEQSKWEVTKEGELHLTNGPGDLQTEKSFKDFCLQLECKTNGDKLNSGIFFRCLPGQYQQGYEAQIHNGFQG